MFQPETCPHRAGDWRTDASGSVQWGHCTLPEADTPPVVRRPIIPAKPEIPKNVYRTHYDQYAALHPEPDTTPPPRLGPPMPFGGPGAALGER